MPKHTTKVGDMVRVCFHGRQIQREGCSGFLRARMSGPLKVTGVWHGGVRVGEGAWHKSWVKVA